MSSTGNPIRSFGKLLNQIPKQSLISSQLWNEIVQDLYTAYSVYKYINTTLQYQFQYEFSYGNQNTLNSLFNNVYFYIFNQKPYPFMPLIQASPGLPLTIEYMNDLIKAITKLANENNITLAKSLNFVQSNEIVTSRKFNDIIYIINQFLTFNFNSYFLLDCNGSLFAEIQISNSAFLNILIYNFQYYYTISNSYIKNLIIYNIVPPSFAKSNNGFYIIIDDQINLNGSSTIYNFLIGTNNGFIYLTDNSAINNFIIYNNAEQIFLYDNSYIQNLIIYQNSPSVSASTLSSLQTLISLNDNAIIENLTIYENYEQIQLNNYSIIVNLIIGTNNGTITLNDNAIIENLVCQQNNGKIVINGNAQIINNNCQ
uniref:Uncharacterized protein n=1 Tax=Sulfolobus islandicus rod-shaped virus 1 TaxID=157898 RepID=Q5W374_SIRV1|nr:hypothetical protein [Sulfolobus islandicus rod-shaped virus 1]